MVEKVTILGKNIRVAFADPPHPRRGDILSDPAVMAELINGTTWPPEYEAAYRLMDKIVFFSDTVTVNTHVMSRSCCDEDDRILARLEEGVHVRLPAGSAPSAMG